MFHPLRRRPSPAAAIAAAALFVALSGTAVAQSDIFISRPDQLANDVVTGPKIAPNSISGVDVIDGVISDSDLDDPQLKVRALPGGGQLADSDGTSSRATKGIYYVTFDTKSLHSRQGDTGPTLLNNNCAFTATSRNRHAVVSVSGPGPGKPNTITVTAASSRDMESGLLDVVDTQFDVLASC